jgi:hypothetical protein
MMNKCREEFERWEMSNGGAGYDYEVWQAAWNARQPEVVTAEVPVPTVEELINVCYETIKNYAHSAIERGSGNLSDESIAVAKAILALLTKGQGGVRLEMREELVKDEWIPKKNTPIDWDKKEQP